MHAARVALVATVIIAALYVVVVLAFNVADRHRLVDEVSTRIDGRLAAVVKAPGQAVATAQYDNAHDLDDAPVFIWAIQPDGRRTALTPGAPLLSRQVWNKGSTSTVARFGNESFLVRTRAAGQTTFVAAQTLGSVDRVA